MLSAHAVPCMQVQQKKPGSGPKLVEAAACICQQLQSSPLGKDQLVELFYFFIRQHAPAVLRSAVDAHPRVKFAVLEVCQAYVEHLLNPSCSLGPTAAAKQVSETLPGLLWDLHVPNCDPKAMLKLLAGDGAIPRERVRAASKSTKMTTEENGLLVAACLALQQSREMESRQVDAALKLLRACMPHSLPQAPDAKLWALLGSSQMLAPLWALYFSPLVITAHHGAPVGNDCLGAPCLESPTGSLPSTTKVTWSDYTVSAGVDALVERQRPDDLLLRLICSCPASRLPAVLQPLQGTLARAVAVGQPGGPTQGRVALGSRAEHLEHQAAQLVVAIADSCANHPGSSIVSLQLLLDALLVTSKGAAEAPGAPALAVNVLLPLLNMTARNSSHAPRLLLHCTTQLHAVWSQLAVAAPRSLAAWLATTVASLAQSHGDDDASMPAADDNAASGPLLLPIAALCNRAAPSGDPSTLVTLLQFYLQQEACCSTTASPSSAGSPAAAPVDNQHGSGMWAGLIDKLSTCIAAAAPALLINSALAAHASAPALGATTRLLRSLAAQHTITDRWAGSFSTSADVAALASALAHEEHVDPSAILRSPVLDLLLKLASPDNISMLPTALQRELCAVEAAVVPNVLLHASSASDAALRKRAVEASIVLMGSFPSSGADDAIGGDLEAALCDMLAHTILEADLCLSLFQAAVKRLAVQDASLVQRLVQNWIAAAEAGSIPAELLARSAGLLDRAARHPSTREAVTSALRADLPQLACVLAGADRQQWEQQLVAPVLHLLGHAMSLTEAEWGQLYQVTAPGSQPSGQPNASIVAGGPGSDDTVKFFCSEGSLAAASGPRQQTTTSQQFLDTKQLLQRKATALLAGGESGSLVQGLGGAPLATAPGPDAGGEGANLADGKGQLVLTPTTVDNLQLVAEVLAKTLDPVILEGDTGVGKSATIAEAARCSDQTLVRFNMSSQVRRAGNCATCHVMSAACVLMC
jgi:hypothetical protein